MDLELIQSAIQWWAGQQSGLPTYWVGAPQPMQLKPRIELDGPVSIEPRGQDWLMWENGSDPDNPAVVPTVVGNRELTVIVRAIGRSSTGNLRAQYWLERLRASLKFPTILDHFHSNGLAVVRCGNTAQYDAELDNRIESVAAMELRFATTIAETDTTADTIAAVTMSSAVEDPAGVPLPVPPNLDNETIGSIGG